jgi:hypothetical protein
MKPNRPPMPHLFAWGEDGIPGEFKAFVAGHGEGGGSSNYQAAGVERLAESVRDQIRLARQSFVRKSGESLPRLSHYQRSMIYMLQAYCAHHGKPAPSDLLWLMFDALELQPEKPAASLEEEIKVVSGVDVSRFLKASLLDGQAVARGEELSGRALAELVGVSRDTIKRWRAMKEYKDRRASVVYAEGQNRRGDKKS